ncbi:MAG: DUF2752 domain-containing protein [Verrucomicrobia bacterium]|nr:DUF2752 domain-containing protein [Verrucomicrobiota bacterium]
MPPAVTRPPTLPPDPGAYVRPPIPIWVIGAGLMGLGLLLFLARVEPAGQGFFPRCWVYETIGIQCPGCGATRAVHALLNGEIERALRLNALFVSLLPLLVWWGVRGLRGWWTGRWWRDPFTHPIGLSTLAGLAVGFSLARNFSF